MKQFLSRLLPFLDENLPEDISFKGISKLSPKIGSFLKQGISQGLPLAGGIDFIRSEFADATERDIDPRLRPDERASLAQRDRSKYQSDQVKKLGKLATSIAGAPFLAESVGQLFSSGSSDSPPQEPEQKKKKFRPLEDILKDLHSSPIGQYIRFAIDKGGDVFDIASHIIRKDPEKARKWEEESGENFENVIQAYIDRIKKKSGPQENVVESQKNPVAQQASNQSMENLMGAINEAIEMRKRRQNR